MLSPTWKSSCCYLPSWYTSYGQIILYSEELLKITNTSAAMIHFSLRQWHPNLWTRWSGALGNCNQRATATVWKKERFPVGFLLNASLFILFWLNCVHHHGPLNTSGWHLRSHTKHITVFAWSFTSSKVSGSALWLQAVLSLSLGDFGVTRESVSGKGGLRKSITAIMNHSHSSSPAKSLCLFRSQKMNLSWILKHKIWPLRIGIIPLSYYKLA